MHLGILFGFGLFSSFVSAIPLSQDGNVLHARGLPLPKYPSDKEAANTSHLTPDPNQELDHSHRTATFKVTFTSAFGVPLSGPAASASDRVAKDEITRILDEAKVHMGVPLALPHSVHFANSYPFQSIPPEGVYFDVTVQPSTTVCDPKCTGNFTHPDVSGARLEGPAHASDDGVAKDGVRTMLDNGSVSMGVSSALPHNVHFVNSYPFSYRPSEGVHFDVTVQPSTTVCDPKCSGNVSGLDHPQGFRGRLKKPMANLFSKLFRHPGIKRDFR
ncbi:hypothetical protein D9757_001035 [Collybiopsis confluens]|uniref:Uncharacterized protein n=1 Tax=Collybiopsis confluens TaxID=2823264 RepID=A0A8H5I0Y8_9AGAR|nr:hypothetical protein D9757_001035 [Collybiopsis confluens]